MDPLVVNKRSGQPYDVYVGRPTEWGNPYSHQEGTLAEHRVATREDAVEAYGVHLWRRIEYEGEPLIRRLADLEGKRLACWCAPASCHAEILVKASKWAKEQLAKIGKDFQP